MDISRKTDYALRMLAMLAEDPERLLSVRTAAEEVNVPYSFARSIQHGLVQAGIVESLQHIFDSKLQAGMLLNKRCKELGLKFDKVKKIYEAA